MTEQADEIIVECDIAAPMRDGTVLDAMIWRPATPGRYPVLIERVAYELAWRCSANGEYYARHGYVVVAQSVRGTYASGGEYSLWRDDGWGANQDGYDTIEWAASQPWSNGRVGMLEGSYSGATQYFTAPSRPPHLRALFVRQGPSDLRTDAFSRGSAHQLEHLRDFIVRSMLLPQLGQRPGILSAPATRVRVEQAAAELQQSLWHLPLKSWPLIEGLADWYFEMLDRPGDGPYWAATDLATVAHEIDLPILHLSGWFDPFLSGVLRAYTSIRVQGRSPVCRDSQRLIVGPWGHSATSIGQRLVGALDFGPEAIFDPDEWRLRWYDHWLKGIENSAMDGPHVRLFLMGTNRWLGFDVWPPPDVTYRPLCLASSPDAGLSQGWLTFEPPGADEPPDAYVYDPGAPVPSLNTRLERLPIDYRPIEDRVMLYTSEPLEQDLHVVGPLTMILTASSSTLDTDWVVRLCDVWPDGRSIFVSDGILRARYRDSAAHPTLLQPGQVYRFEVDLGAIAQTFLAGHQLRVHVTSSDFPRYDRNLNTGGRFGEEDVWQVATNTVFHDALHPSHLLLPILSDDAVSAATL